MSEIKDLQTQVDDLTIALEQFGVFNLNASKKMGVFEKQQKKVTTAIKKSPIYGIGATLAGFGKAIANVTKITGKNVAMTTEQKEDHRKGMTVMQKLAAATISHGLAQKLSNKILTKSNTLFSRLLVSAFSLVSIFLIVGFALAALSIAFDGANSPLLKMTEDLGPLHDAMQGLVLVISGEGDEGNLSTGLDILAAGLLTAGVASLLLGGTVGVLLGALVIAVGGARMFYNEFENMYAAIAVGIGIFTSLVGVLLIVLKTMAALKAGTVIAIKGTVGAVMLGIGLVIAGIAGLVAFAMGAGDGIQAVLLAILSAFAIFVGLFLIGLAVVPAAIIAAALLLVAIIYRYWDEVVLIFETAWAYIYGFGALIYYGLLAGLALISGLILGTAQIIIGSVLGLVTGVFNALFQLGVSFAEDVIFGGESLLDWFLSIPETLYDGFVDGFKSVFNAVIDIYNDFAEMMSFEIPDWVPGIGGDEFNLPTITPLAKGGIVTGPTIALVGEDGPEAVVPLNRKNNPTGIGVGGGGVTVNINVGGVTDRTDKKQLAREIGDLIRAEMQRGGRSHGNRRSGV